MKDFFSRYSYDSMKMLLDQIAISIFGFSLAMTAVSIKNDTLLMGVSIGAIIFYLALLYGVATRVGHRDKVSIDLGKRTFHPLMGTWISLLANSINLVLATILTVMAFAAPESNPVVPRAIALLIQGMYQGLLATIQVNDLPMTACWWSYFLITLPAILISTVGYIAGVKDWRLTSFSPSELPASDRPTRKEIKERKQAQKKSSDNSSSRKNK